jgi:hypothetical protein
VLFGGRNRGSRSRSIFGGVKEGLRGVSICPFVRSCCRASEERAYNSEDFLRNGMAEACGMSDINIKPTEKKSDS